MTPQPAARLSADKWLCSSTPEGDSLNMETEKASRVFKNELWLDGRNCNTKEIQEQKNKKSTEDKRANRRYVESYQTRPEDQDKQLELCAV